MSNTVGKLLLASIIDSERPIQEYLSLHLDEKLFTGSEIDVFNLIDQHIRNYGKVPTRKTIDAETDVLLPDADEPPAYYMNKVDTRYVQQRLKKAMNDTTDLLKAKKVGEAFNNMFSRVSELDRHTTRNQIIDYSNQGFDVLRDEYVAQATYGDEYSIKTGWETIDNLNAGLLAGDFVSIVGRPSAGKTYLGLYLAEYVWRVQKKTPLFLSMEMKPLQIMQRIAAINHNKPITQLKRGELSKKQYEGLFAGLHASKGEDHPPFWVIDGALSASVQSLQGLVQHIKPDVVIIDGAYLLQDTSYRGFNRNERVGVCAESIKREICEGLSLPVVNSYQLNREAAKEGKKKGGHVGIEHIGFSDAIGQVSSLVLGLLEEENVSTIQKRHVSILKGRNGETGGFDINWYFDTRSPHNKRYMDFSEIKKITDAENDKLLTDTQFL